MISEFLPHFIGQAGHLGIVNLIGQRNILLRTCLVYVSLLTIQIACVLALNLNLIDHHRWQPGKLWCHDAQCSCQRYFRHFQELTHTALARKAHSGTGDQCISFRRTRSHPKIVQLSFQTLNRLGLFTKCRPTLIIDQLHLAPDFCQPDIGVVFAKLKAVLGAAGKHTIRLARPPGDQVIYQHTDISFIPTRCPCFKTLYLPRGIQPGDQSLRTCLFITRCTVDLTREKERGNTLGFQGCV